jgi:hypothetical protein
MKTNYELDDNKLFNLPQRKYDKSESSYFVGDPDTSNMYGTLRYDKRGPAKGSWRGGKGKYVDFDNPSVNE